MKQWSTRAMICGLLLIILVRVEVDTENSVTLLAKMAEKLMQLPLKQSAGSNVINKYASIILQPSPDKHEKLAVIKLQTNFKKVITVLWDTLNNENMLSILRKVGNGINILLQQFKRLRGDIYALSKSIDDSGTKRMLDELSTSDEGSEWTVVWDALQEIQSNIDQTYGIFDNYQDEMVGKNLTDERMEDFSKSILGPRNENNSLVSLLIKLHQLTVGNTAKKTSIFAKFHQHFEIKNGSVACSLKQTKSYLIYHLYTAIALLEIKGYSMIQFSYMVFKLQNKENYSPHSEIAIKNYEMDHNEKLLRAKQVLKKTSRKFRMCDPAQHIEGLTFVQITKLLQGYIENEVDMNNVGTCSEECRSYSVTSSKKCYKSTFCNKQKRCRGRIFDCQFINADAWICMSDNERKRRYNWIEYEDGTQLGKKNSPCKNVIKVDSWWRVLVHCSYCLCKCDETGPDSDRYWSLKNALSDTIDNKVVTGVRFAKRDRVIHIEIQQATAMPQGNVDEKSREWKMAKKTNVENATLQNVDFMSMNYEERSLDIDNLESPLKNHVITGVRLRKIGNHLNMEAHITPINFESGRLDTGRSTWIGNDATPVSIKPREKVNIMGDISTNFKGQSMVDTVNNQFITFETTSADADVMQTTIPFIDIQPASPFRGTWLSGIGIYHKGSPGYGGYIGLSVTSIDYSRFI